MGNIKDIGDFIKDFLKGVEIKREVKRLIDNMVFAIDSNTISKYFPDKYRKLEELAPKIKWKNKDKDFLEKYKKIKQYYESQYGNVWWIS